MASAEVVALLERRNGYASELAAIRDEGSDDVARVAKLRAAKDQADAELDRLVGPEPGTAKTLTLLQLMAL